MNNSPFSAHSDVLSASPTTPEEQSSLLNELKSRGRSCVASKNYPSAESLYSKAIDVLLTSSESDQQKADLSILYSNRSLCRLQMNNVEDAISDATSATCYDPGYLKGYWRLGQACVAAKKLGEGMDAYKRASELEGGSSNKALAKEIRKVEKLMEQEEEKRKKEQKELEDEKKKSENENQKDPKPKPKPNAPSKPKPTSSTSASNTTTTSAASKTTSSTETIEESDEFTKSEHIRGYKIVGGKKTSFFHHEQTEEEKRLIGDITPKRLDVASTTTNNNDNAPQPLSNSTTNNNDKTSAWNKAGTWEERDVTEWAVNTLESALLEQCHYTLPPSSPDPGAKVTVTKITKLKPTTSASSSSSSSGGKKDQSQSHASVATVRGKKRYIFEFNICLHWELVFGNGVDTCRGTLTMDDVDGTHELGDGYDLGSFTVDDDAASAGSGELANARFLLERFVRDGGFREVVEQTLDGWIRLFRETY